MFRCFFSDFLFVLFSFWEFTHAWNAPRVDAVDGSWSMWSAWSQCSVTCGQGERKQFRSCSNPAPNFGGRWCSGLNQQFGDCAAPLECPVNGAWSEWGLWTACSVSCGQGTRHRYRACDNPLPQVGGRPCRGNSQETDDCALVKECPRDGHWSSWSKWSMCSVTCGGDGTRLRYRSCNNPPPSGEGVECPGPNRGVRQCAAGQECPVQEPGTRYGTGNHSRPTGGAYGPQVDQNGNKKKTPAEEEHDYHEEEEDHHEEYDDHEKDYDDHEDDHEDDHYDDHHHHDEDDAHD